MKNKKIIFGMILLMLILNLSEVISYAGNNNWTYQNTSPLYSATLYHKLVYSYDGTKLFYGSSSGDIINISTNYGVTWSQSFTPFASAGSSCGAINSLALNSTTQKIIASCLISRPLVISNDGGTTWTTTGATLAYRDIAMSENGTYILTSNASFLFLSTDGGATWTTKVNDTSRNWATLSMSKDGKYMYAGQTTSNTYPVYSSDYGATWTITNSPVRYDTVDTNYNGSIVYVGGTNGCFLAKSINYGVTYTNITNIPYNTGYLPSSNRYTTIKTNIDGTMVIIGTIQDFTGRFYVSNNSGTNWQTKWNDSTVRSWYGATGTSDFNHLAIYNSVSSAPIVRGVWTSDYSTPLSIIFNNQDPADIGTLTFGTVNITYNITNANISTIKLYHKTNNTVSDCWIYTNGTSLCGYYPKDYVSNSSNTFLFQLQDNNIFPGTYNFNEMEMENAVKLERVLTGTNQLLSIELLNLTNYKHYNVFEIMANTTGTSNIYYCNNSYISGSISVSPNCVQIGQLKNTTYNHQHNTSYHQIFPISINITTGMIGSVKITDKSYFIIRGSNIGSTSVFYITNNSREGAIKYSSNQGVAWTNQTYTIDAHLHQYNNDSLWYYVCANDSTTGAGNCSTTREDLLILAGLPPMPPAFISPIENTNYTAELLINYTSAQSPNDYPIVYYNLTLLDSAYSFKEIITANNSINLEYLYNISHLQNDGYYIQVGACDNMSQCSYSTSDLFYVNNLAPIIETLNITPENFTTYDNITISANITLGTNPLSSVWAVIWQGIITIWEGTLSLVGDAWEVVVPTNSSFEGELNVTIYANDTIGNNATPITTIINGENTAPVIELNSPNNNYLFDIGTLEVNLNWTSSDNNPNVTDLVYITNGSGYYLLSNETHIPGTYNQTVSTVDGYTYYWYINSTDSDGLSNVSETYKFKINSTTPSYENFIIYPTPVNESQTLYMNITVNNTDILSIFVTINGTNLSFTQINATDYYILINTTGLSDVTDYTINANMVYGDVFELYAGNVTVYNGEVSLIYSLYPYVPFWEVVTISANLTSFVDGSFVSGANVTMYLNSTDDYAVAKMTENVDTQTYDIALRFTNKTRYDFTITGEHSLYYNFSGYFDVAPLCNISVRLWKDLNKSDLYKNEWGYIFFSYEPPSISERAMQRNEWAYTMLINFKEWGDSVVNFTPSRQYRFKTQVFHAKYTDGVANINIPCGEWAYYFVSGDWQFNPVLSYDWAYVDEEYSRSLYLPRTNLNITDNTVYDFYVTEADLYPDEVFWRNVLIWGGLAFILVVSIIIGMTTGNMMFVMNFILVMVALLIMTYGSLWLFWFKW